MSKNLDELVPTLEYSQGKLPKISIIKAKWCSDFLIPCYLDGSNINFPVNISNSIQPNDHISAVSL